MLIFLFVRLEPIRGVIRHQVNVERITVRRTIADVGFRHRFDYMSSLHYCPLTSLSYIVGLNEPPHQPARFPAYTAAE